jgi:dihydroflavonol-4-reductase
MILITGATGLLGSNLLIELVKTNSQLVALYQTEKKIEKVKQLFNLLFLNDSDNQFNKIKWVKCDLLDIVSLNENIKECQYVYHCAAFVSFRRRDFLKLMKINAVGTANIVNLCLEHKIKKLCHVSSTSAIGKTQKDDFYHVVESNKWTQSNETSGYGISKYTAEKEVWRGIEEGLNAVIINPSVIFGPASWDESSMTIFRTINNGLKFYTNGTNAFVDVRNVVESMIFLMNSDIHSQRFLCTGNNISFKSAFELISKKLNKKPPSIYANKWLCEIAWRLSSLIALFTGKATITKESAQSSQNKVEYDSSKLLDLMKIDFYPLEETIDYCINNRLN